MSISSFLTKKFLKSLFFPAHNRGKALPKGLIRLLKKQPGLWDLPELPEIGSPLSNSGLIHDAQISISKKVNSQKLKLPSGKVLKGQERKLYEVQKIKLNVLRSEKIIGLN